MPVGHHPVQQHRGESRWRRCAGCRQCQDEGAVEHADSGGQRRQTRGGHGGGVTHQQGQGVNGSTDRGGAGVSAPRPLLH